MTSKGIKSLPTPLDPLNFIFNEQGSCLILDTSAYLPIITICESSASQKAHGLLRARQNTFPRRTTGSGRGYTLHSKAFRIRLTTDPSHGFSIVLRFAISKVLCWPKMYCGDHSLQSAAVTRSKTTILDIFVNHDVQSQVLRIATRKFGAFVFSRVYSLLACHCRRLIHSHLL